MRGAPLTAFPELLLAAVLSASNVAAQPAEARVIREIRFWSLDEVTRVAVETSAEIQYRAERIASPDRIFFDLLEVRPRPGLRAMQVIPVGDRLLKQIRMAETQPGVTRVVLDLAAPVEFTTSHLTNPDRLLIELRAAGSPPAPAGRAGVGPAAPPSPASAPEETPAGSQPAPVPQALERPGPIENTSVPASATAAKRDSSGNRSLVRALGLKLERVLIDPGHGGRDAGSVSPGGLAEKELVLDIAKRLGALVAERMGSQVTYTRADDTFVPLEARTEMANQQKADLFISLHANSSRLRWIAGSETYYLNFTTSASALEVASRENATSEKSIHELQELVQKIALKTKAQESREFAAAVQRALYSNLWKGKTSVKDRGLKRAPFLVLIGASMPAVLVEIDFLSNPRAEKLLQTAEYRQRVAEALFKGLAQYASTLSHFQVARTKAGL